MLVSQGGSKLQLIIQLLDQRLKGDIVHANHSCWDTMQGFVKWYEQRSIGNAMLTSTKTGPKIEGHEELVVWISEYRADLNIAPRLLKNDALLRQPFPCWMSTVGLIDLGKLKQRKPLRELPVLKRHFHETIRLRSPTPALQMALLTVYSLHIYSLRTLLIFCCLVMW